MWAEAKDGEYSVKLGYQTLRRWDSTNSNQASCSSSEDPLWNKIWNMNVPPKYANLMWRIFHNCLPTRSNLRHKGVLCTSQCPRRESTTEDIKNEIKRDIQAVATWEMAGFHDVLAAEMAVMKTVEFLRHFHYDQALVMSDSMGVVTAIRNNCFPNNYWGLIADRVHQSGSRLAAMRIMQVRCSNLNNKKEKAIMIRS
ncbi:retrotransposon unclassified-like protein [Trifolium medium]|uniref:Retrotransposon unclassified-like protein n=1 Tax=Trifolium medium TaxID=97028 RepID=A0A392M128_9FABA|nr:retrotransposon unclassified-like protein [Trifolium medium]